MAICNNGVAMKAGTNAGIIAELLSEHIRGKEAVTKYGKTWCRCSFKTITVACPFLSMGQIEYAVNALRDRGIIISKKLGAAKFDHTNWYAFTEYGQKIMEWGDDHEGFY